MARDLGGMPPDPRTGNSDDLRTSPTGRTVMAVRRRSESPLAAHKEAILTEHRNQVDIVEGELFSSPLRDSIPRAHRVWT